MPGHTAGAWGEAAEELLTGSVVSLRLLGACSVPPPWGLPTPFTCSADSRWAQGECPRSAQTGAPVQTEKYSQRHTSPSICTFCLWGQIVLGSAIKGLCGTSRLWASVSLITR